jgi:hypothetical protein
MKRPFKAHVINVTKSNGKVVVTFKKGPETFRATKDNNIWSGCKINKAGRNCGDIWNINYEYNFDMSRKFNNIIDFINAAR